MRLYDNEGYREEFMALVYDLLHGDGTNDCENQIIDAFDMAPMVEAEPLFPNDPLTLEELREMGEEPYWHVGLQDDSPPPHWAILPSNVAQRPQDHFYGKYWLAYRRKPEEVDTCQKTSSLSG